MGKWVIAAVLAAMSIGVAGCQSAHTAPATQTKSVAWNESPQNKALIKAIEEYEISPELDGEAEEVGAAMGEQLVMLCLDRSHKESLQECFHRQMLAAFDVHGVAGERCPLNDDTEVDFQCIVLASYSYGMAKRAGGEALADFDWWDLEGSTLAATHQMAVHQVAQCLSNGSASDPKECVIAGVAKQLGLNKEDLEPCEAIEDDEKLGECIGNAYGLKEFEAALARLQELQA